MRTYMRCVHTRMPCHFPEHEAWHIYHFFCSILFSKRPYNGVWLPRGKIVAALVFCVYCRSRVSLSAYCSHTSIRYFETCFVRPRTPSYFLIVPAFLSWLICCYMLLYYNQVVGSKYHHHPYSTINMSIIIILIQLSTQTPRISMFFFFFKTRYGRTQEHPG